MVAFKFEDISSGKVLESIKNHDSFEIIGLSGKKKEAVMQLENIIENEGLRCRVYTKGRIVAAGGSLFGGITGVLGAASVIGMAAHNLATYDPDYEIAKNIVDNKFSVTYMKK